MPQLDLHKASCLYNKQGGIPLKNHADGITLVDTLHTKAVESWKCPGTFCTSSVVGGFIPRKDGDRRTMTQEAQDLIGQVYQDRKMSEAPSYEERVRAVKQSIKDHGTYDLTTDELKFAVVTAWRNAGRCIGRFFYHDLEVMDCRHITTCQEMFDCLIVGLQYSQTNQQRPCITIFPKREPGKADFRLWNPRSLKFAGFTTPEGDILGNPDAVTLTEIAVALGWNPPRVGPNVPMPLVLSGPDGGPFVFELPEDVLQQVKIEHPKYPRFAEADLFAFSVATVCDLALDAGGTFFPTTAVNAPWIHSELAKNFLDVNRMNQAKLIADLLAIDTSDVTWRDQVYFETGAAILSSFKQGGFNIGHHFNYSESFVQYHHNEMTMRGGCPSEWIWLASFPGSSNCSIYHQEMLNYKLKPCYEQQDNAWKSFQGYLPWPKRRFTSLRMGTIAKVVRWLTSCMRKINSTRLPICVLYASEGGKAQRFATDFHNTARQHFHSKLVCMADCSLEQLHKERFVVSLVSTFGDGGPPTNGAEMFRQIEEAAPRVTEKETSAPLYAIFAFGNSVYTNFCGFGTKLDGHFERLGWSRMAQLVRACELEGEDALYKTWSAEVLQTLQSYLGAAGEGQGPLLFTRSPSSYHLEKLSVEVPPKQSLLESFHNRTVVELKCTESRRLTKSTEKSVHLVRLSTDNADNSYQCGDYLLVFPQNDAAEVDRLRQRLSIDKPSFNNDVYAILTAEGESHQLPSCTFQQAFTYLLDIRTPPSQELIARLAETSASNSAESDEALADLAEDTDSYSSWKFGNWQSLPDFLESYPDLDVEITDLLVLLPHLKPRSYSISSSPSTDTSMVDLTISRTGFKPSRSDGIVNGLCSNYLIGSQIQQSVFGYFRSAPHFRLPEMLTFPILLISAGSGFAPFRGMLQELQHRKENGTVLPPVLVFFGCRNQSEMFYRSEMNSWLGSGVISVLRIAFSQEKEKKYVHHLLESMAEEVFLRVFSEEGHVYVCGRVEMAENVLKMFAKLAKRARSTTLFENLKTSGRYHEDIFTTASVPIKNTDRILEALEQADLFDDPARLRADMQPTATRTRRSSEVMIRNIAQMVKLARTISLTEEESRTQQPTMV